MSKAQKVRVREHITYFLGGRTTNEHRMNDREKIKIKRYKMNKCFAPAVFHLSCHLGSDYANLLPFCSRSFFFFSLLFFCRLFLCFFVIFFCFLFYEKKIYVSADMKFMVCFGLSRATYLIVLVFVFCCFAHYRMSNRQWNVCHRYPLSQ